MKKLLLLSLAICIGFYANAQRTKSLVPKNLQNISAPCMKKLTGEEVLPIVFQESNYYTKKKLSIDPLFGEIIGITYYDLQTNSGLPNRLVTESNGNISAVWTMATDDVAGYPTRGSGFNYYNGTSWLPAPLNRIEPVRVGWPNIAITGTDQIVTTHAASSGYYAIKPISGTTWTTGTFATTAELIWPRMVANGNVVHLIGTTDTATPFGTTGFTNGCLVYWRSTNGGQSWVDQDRMLPNMDTVHFSVYPSFQDDYNMAIKGDTVAILLSNVLSGTCMWKSTDAGVNWTFIDILNPPSRKFYKDGGMILDFNGDSEQDQIYGSDGSSCVVLDNNGMAHCFFGNMKNTSDGGGSSYYPYTDGIYYWKESMGPINYQFFWQDQEGVPTYIAIPDTNNFQLITWMKDLNGNGEINFPTVATGEYPFGVYQTSLTSQITACVDKNNAITMIYTSPIEGYSVIHNGVERLFRNLYMLSHKASMPYNQWDFNPIYPDSGRIVADNLTEEVFPVMLKKPLKYVANDSAVIAFTYMADELPGNSLQPTAPNHEIVENTIWFKMISLTPDGINEINVSKAAPVVYPNPSSNNVTVSYNLSDATKITVSIYNMVGQQIMTTNQNVIAGDVKVTLNIEALPQGVYFIKSDIGKQSYTNKLVKN